MKMVLLLLSWTVYYVLHSLLASLELKNAVRKAFPRIFRWYRLIYNGVAVALLFPPAYLQLGTESRRILSLSFPFTISGYGLLVTGLIIVMLSFRKYNLGEFAGLTPMSEFDKERTLVVSGLNAYVRHPLYTGVILSMAGYLLVSFTFKTLLVVVVSLVYIIIGTLLEEQKLRRVYGSSYEEYRRKTGMYFPKI
jgi:methanethiol S-methyltransferase